MKTKIEFNWEKYQSGEYDCVTRDGRNVEQLHRDNDVNYPICGKIDGIFGVWTTNGVYNIHFGKSNSDLFLIQKEDIVETNEMIVPEIKSTLMEVSDFKDFKVCNRKEVLGKYNSRYIVSEDILHITTYKYARPIKEIKECWVNILENEGFLSTTQSFKSKDDAISFAELITKQNPTTKYIKTIKIDNRKDKIEH